MEFKTEGKYKSDDTYEKKAAFLAAYEFVKRYMESEGFKQRFKSKKWMETPEGHVVDKIDPFDIIEYQLPENSRIPFEDIEKIQYHIQPEEINDVDLTDDPEYFNNAYYSMFNGNFGVGKSIGQPYNDDNFYIGTPKLRPKNNYLTTLFHEFGHWLDDSIKVKVFDRNHPEGAYTRPLDFNYSARIPVFRLNNDYAAILESTMTRPNVHTTYWNYPEVSELPHDSHPTESYADLIQFRALLDRFGIYDSTKPNNPFTQEHLDLFRTLGLKCRLESLFSDDLIIWMMNNVADNSVSPKVPDKFNINSPAHVEYT